MTWIPAIAIGGAVLAGGPVLIHILFRWRYQVIEFAAFRFLLESRRRSRQRLRLEELILIALRVLACLLVGLALANIRSPEATGGADAPTAHVFVLDDSMSMGQVLRAETLYGKAVAHVLGRIAAASEADRVAIVSACRPGAAAPTGPGLLPAGEAKRGELAARLKGSAPTDLRADFPAAIKAAAALIASRQQRMPVRLYVVSDFRRADFAGPAAGAVRGALAAMDPASVDLLLLDFGLPCETNLTVEQVAPGRSIVVAGASTPMRVTVRNTARRATAAGRLEVNVGEAALPVQPVPPLAPGQRAEVEFACTFEAPSSASVRVALPGDDLPADSTRVLALPVRDALRVLIVDGSGSPGDPNSASFALANALDPSGSGAFGRRVEVRAADTWGAATLSAYDLVILTNVRDFPPARGADGGTTYPAVRALEDYVRAGGGLVIFAGERLGTAFYNGPLYADGRGLCPLPLADGPPRRAGGEGFVRLNAASIAEEPMLRVLSEKGANFARFLRFSRYMAALRPDAGAGAAPDAPRVLAEFSDGSPAVARRTCGKGTVVMWYASPQTSWTNWPKDLSFLPAMNDMAWQLARTAENIHDDVTGRSIGYTLPGRLSGALSAVLKTPAYPKEDLQTLALQDDGRQRTVSYAAPPHAGLYELMLALADRTEHKVLFSRHPDARESELARASQEEIRAAIDRPFTRVEGLAEGAGAVRAAGRSRSLWWALLAAAAAVLLAETVLGLRFAHYVPRAGGRREAA